MNGTVTISLKDYEEMKNSSEATNELKTKLLTAAKELEIFLSYLIQQENIDEHINDYNRNSETGQILIENGRAKIKIKDIKD